MTPARPDIDVRWFDLRDGALQRAELLSNEEHARAAALRDAAARRRFIASHVALRRVLGERLGVPAPALGLHAPRGRRPSVDDAPRLGVSLSRAADWVVVALAEDLELGVDAAVEHAAFGAEAFMAQVPTPHERHLLDAMPPGAREAACGRLWTRKEAVLKALGTGLAVAPATIELGTLDATSEPRFVEPLGVHWVDVDGPVPGVTAALAWRALRK